jgi:hypothetical protein
MKQAVLLALCVLMLRTGFASPSREIPHNWNDTTSSALPSIDDLFGQIVSVTGLQQGFTLKEADVRNMEASISHKKRFILYNQQFVNWLFRVTRNKWAVATLLAHELGHHLNGHTINRKKGSRPEVELEADEFAGFVLYRLGASLPQAQEVMKYIATQEGSRTHPGRAARMEAVKKGWERAEGNTLANSQ